MKLNQPIKTYKSCTNLWLNVLRNHASGNLDVASPQGKDPAGYITSG